jgi:hypothetical protein
MDNGRDPDTIDPIAERDPKADSGVEQAEPTESGGRSSEEEPSAAETFDAEGAGLAAKE